MLKKIFFILAIGFGMASSGYFGWRFAKKKYQQISDDEIAAIKKLYTSHYGSKSDTNKPEPIQKPDMGIPATSIEKTPVSGTDKKEYKNYAKPYASQSKTPEIKKDIIPQNKEKEGTADKSPYVISPEEFNESNYETQTLFYYADRVLADDDENIIENIHELIGDEALTQFGVYEQDCVYVRNERFGIDYEILLDERQFYKTVARNKDRNLEENKKQDEDDNTPLDD